MSVKPTREEGNTFIAASVAFNMEKGRQKSTSDAAFYLVRNFG